MAQTEEEKVLDIFTDGLENFGDLINNRSWAISVTRAVSKDVKDTLLANISAQNACKFAFPTLVILPNHQRLDCFVAVLDDKVVIAWRQGIFKKTTICRKIPRDSIKKASWSISNSAGTRGVKLLSIEADGTTIIALPKGNPQVANDILAAVRAQ